MNKKTYIYALLDPDTEVVRYVGKSDNPERRLLRHLGFYEKKETHKTRWLRKLVNEGKRPLLKILEEVSIEEWGDKERYWISMYKENLTNTADGGIGGNGYNGEWTEERKTAASERAKKRHQELELSRIISNYRVEYIGDYTLDLIIDKYNGAPIYDRAIEEKEFREKGIYRGAECLNGYIIHNTVDVKKYEI